MAATLRAEMAAALVELGDEYGGTKEGSAFASDFYVAALVFDADNPDARDKAPVTAAQLAALSDAAARGEFSDAQRVAHQPLTILADREPTRRAKKAAAYAKTKAAPSATRTQIAEVVETPVAAPPFVPPRTAVAMREPRPEPAPAEPAPAEPEPQSEPEEPEGDRPAVDTGASKAAAKEGRAALARGDFATAKARFHRALKFNPRNRGALEGLAEVSFQQNRPTEAAGYLRKALRLAPKNKRLHLDLGDAYLNVLNYPKALKAYRTAEKLGSRKAAQRIALVEARAGGSKK